VRGPGILIEMADVFFSPSWRIRRIELATSFLRCDQQLPPQAATDYGIFIFGRYREARGAGEDRETAYYTTFRSVTPVIVGSGLTIAGATFFASAR
jgi:hypothetical protein